MMAREHPAPASGLVRRKRGRPRKQIALSDTVGADLGVRSLEPLAVRVPVAMQLTGLGRSKLYELIKAGQIKVVKVGTSTLITMASLRALVDGGI